MMIGSLDSVAAPILSWAREQQPALHYVQCSLHGITVGIWSAADEVRRELDDRFGAYYEFRDGGQAPTDYEIIALVSDRRPDVEPVFALGREVAIQPHLLMERYRRAGLAVDDEAWRLVKQVPSETIVLTERTTRTMVATNHSPGTLAKDTRRLLRDVVAAALIQRGAVELHASGVARNDLAVAFAGSSNAGKTTLLVETLRARAGDLLCNGRVFLRAAEDRITALGVPEHILFRPGTLAQIPELRVHWPSELTAAVDRGEDIWQRDQTQKVSVQVRDLLACLQVRAVAAAELRVIALVDLTAMNDGTPIVPLSAAIGEHIDPLLGDDRTYQRRLWHGAVTLDPATVAAHRAAVLAALAERVQVVTVQRSPQLAAVPAALFRLAEGSWHSD
jgi:hypothetical protein